uniref:non-specific serine/threonine protein kinase n=1 Tax=Ditylenchus dipsaci TaxID=166011 RepID=A0A915DYA6_9BILA
MYLEHCILLSLVGKSHIPMMRCSGQIRGCSFIAMDLLGRNLSELRRREKSRTFSFGTTYRIAPQILDGLRHIHDIGYLHRDVKPSNCCIGKQAHDRRMIYILDFGMTRFRGTIRYASPRVHARQESGPADDLISLLYSVVELGDGTLPWTHIREPAQVEKSKTQTKLSILCEKQPIELLKFAEHVTQLAFDQMPDYELIISLFQKCVPAGVSVATLFDWELKEHRTKAEVKEHPSAENSSIDLAMWILNRTSNRCLTIGMNIVSPGRFLSSRQLLLIPTTRLCSSILPLLVSLPACNKGGKGSTEELLLETPFPVSDTAVKLYLPLNCNDGSERRTTDRRVKPVDVLVLGQPTDVSNVF